MPHLHLTHSDPWLAVDLDGQQARVPWADAAALAMQAHRRRDDPIGYGRALFDLIFADATLRQALAALPAAARLYLTTDDPTAAAMGWEYLRDQEGRLVASRLSLVRGLTPAEQPAAGRADPLANSTGLEIVAIPVAPIDDPRPLNTELEWQRLVDAVQKAGRRLTLRRVRPPTLTRLERSLDSAATGIVYFMGHSDSADGRGRLCFEDQRCRTYLVDAADFADALTPGVVFVMLNSCRSAVAAETTAFANIARGLVRRGVPYALGMQFVLPDEAALVFGEALFDLLLKGRTVEEAVRGARRSLEHDTRLVNREWLAGIPVLYTARPEEAGPISLAPLLPEGRPAVDPDPDRLAAICDLSALPAAAQFVGRRAEIGQVLDALLDPNGADFVVIHGLGGIGKTALARAVAERVGWRYGDRVLAFSFEGLARRDEAQGTWQVDGQFADRFTNRLARFYDLDPAHFATIADLQAAILQRRAYVNSLLVLDNVETLLDARRRHPDAALAGLAAFVGRLREGLGSVLLTTRIAPPADWGRCRTIPLGGLDEAAGAALFAGLLPAGRRAAAREAERRRLSRRVGGHPLSIRLLAGRFAEGADDLAAFLDDLEAHLQRAEQSAPASLEDPERQRTLYACLAYSVDRLTEAQRRALQQVTVFQSLFPREFGAAVIADEGEAAVRLQELVRLGLLTEGYRAFADGSLTLLELHPVVRWYLAQRLPPPDEAAYRRHAEVYAELARLAFQREGAYDRSPRVRALVQGSLADLDQALRHLPPAAAAALAFHLSQAYQRLGNVPRALELLEEALEVYTQLGAVRERAVTLGDIARLKAQGGDVAGALALHQERLQIFEQLGDVRSRAVTLGDIARLKAQGGDVAGALALHQEELSNWGTCARGR
jgi:tetratricopeptide (TPR) repeat protein